MKRTLIYLALLLATLSVDRGVEAGLWDSTKNFFTNPKQNPPALRILVETDKPFLTVEVKGRYKVYDPRDNSHIITRKIGKKETLKIVGDGLMWGEEFPGVHQLLIVPDDLSILTVIDGVEYQGSIYIYDVEGKLSVVNRIDLEYFLNSILTPLFPETTSEELLAAVAIAARTNLYYLAANPKNTYWAINGKDINYLGYKTTGNSDSIMDAIHMTRYMVLGKNNAYEGVVDPILAEWQVPGLLNVKGGRQVLSKIDIAEGKRLAAKGDNAAQILKKAFPEATIQLIQTSPGAI